MAYHRNEDIRDYYTMEDELGRGSFAIVRMAVNRETGDQVAIKIFQR